MAYTLKKMWLSFPFKGPEDLCAYGWLNVKGDTWSAHSSVLKYFENHSYAKRLSVNEVSLLVDMPKMSTLNQRNHKNISTMKSAYNWKL